jgi:hypothetical protein
VTGGYEIEHRRQYSVDILDGDARAATRVYLEDLAISLMRPPFSVDIER